MPESRPRIADTAKQTLNSAIPKHQQKIKLHHAIPLTYRTVNFKRSIKESVVCEPLMMVLPYTTRKTHTIIIAREKEVKNLPSTGYQMDHED